MTPATLRNHKHKSILPVVMLFILPALPGLDAQTVNKAPESTAPAAPSAQNPDDEVVQLTPYEVTGSRIRTLVGEQTALPVFSMPQFELEQRGITRLADVRWAIPQMSMSLGYNNNYKNGGTSRAQTISSTFALRGLEGNTTLILIDGKRVPHTGQSAPGGAGGREDFNIDGIPASAIERIEVLPQGAGAIYGADAIAGVINVILKKNYTGGEIQLSYDNTFDTDVARKEVSLTGGIRTGKLSAFLTLNVAEQAGLATADRWWLATDRSPFGGTNSLLSAPYSGPGTLSTGYYPDINSPYSPPASDLPGLTIRTAGIPAGSTGIFTASDAAAAAIGPHYDISKHSMEIDPSRSRSTVLKLDYELATWLVPYAQLRWSKFKNNYTGSPTTLTQQLPAAYPGNPFGAPVYLTKVFYDLPRPSIQSDQINSGLVLGVRGDLPLHDWRYDGSFSWARNTTEDHATNNGFDFSKLSAAINAAQPIILTYDSSTPGTDPNAPGAVQALLNHYAHKDVSDVYEYALQADGSVWSGWAGDIKLAVGGASQQEKVSFYYDPPVSYLLSRPFDRRTNAIYAEISVPLLSEAQGIPLVHKLNVNGAVRFEDLSDIGNHTTRALSLLFQPKKWLSLRASRTEGFKAPKLYELLAPIYETDQTIYGANRYIDRDRNDEPLDENFNYHLVSGGQPHLKPEKSVTRNAGIVLDVPINALKGLSFAVDFWDIDYTDKVGTPGYQVILDFFPERVTRAAPGNDGLPGKIIGIDTSSINLAKEKLHGSDYRVSYQRSFANAGAFFFSFAYARLSNGTTKAMPSSPNAIVIRPNRSSASLFWTRGPLGAGVSVNYQSAAPKYTGAVFNYSAYTEVNPQISYDFARDSHFKGAPGWRRILDKTKVSLTVINALKKAPSDFDAANSNYVGDPRLQRYIVTLTKAF
ncbi:MAG: TonB-dependent receptor [Opitutaceae bacterium]|jgi:outer membrane receptor protein involved in Fe transport|nr:TonB-dependent receptor [Opitutaceae bacterium]